MKRSTGWSVVVIALLVLIGFSAASGPGGAPRVVIAATEEATVAPTEEATESTPEETGESTEEPVAETTPTRAPGAPPDYIEAPSVTSGAVGITLGESERPVRLQSVIPDGPAGKAGLQAGDAVIAVNGQTIDSREGLISIITSSKEGDELTFTIRRGSQQQDIQVPVSTRGAVYCPLPAPTGKAGKALAKNPLDDPTNWVLSPGVPENVVMTVENGKLAFESDDPAIEWSGLATLKTNRVDEFIYSVEITQTSRAVSGLVFNWRSREGFYVLQIVPNGSWTMSAVFADGSTAGGLSFTDPNIKTANLNDPKSTMTNTVTVQVQNGNIYISFNGKLGCGTSLTQFGDPPLARGQIGIYAQVVEGTTSVSYTNLTFTEVEKS